MIGEERKSVSPGEQEAEDVFSEEVARKRAIEHYSEEVKSFVDGMVEHEKYDEQQIRFLFGQASVQLSILRNLIMISRGWLVPDDVPDDEPTTSEMIEERDES